MNAKRFIIFAGLLGSPLWVYCADSKFAMPEGKVFYPRKQIKEPTWVDKCCINCCCCVLYCKACAGLEKAPKLQQLKKHKSRYFRDHLSYETGENIIILTKAQNLLDALPACVASCVIGCAKCCCCSCCSKKPKNNFQSSHVTSQDGKLAKKRKNGEHKQNLQEISSQQDEVVLVTARNFLTAGSSTAESSPARRDSPPEQTLQ